MSGFSLWQAAELLSRFWHYLAIAALAGRLYISLLAAAGNANQRQALSHNSPVFLFWVVTGALAAATLLFVQTGEINQRGLAGMFDPLMLEILWQSPTGQALQFKLLGFALLLLAWTSWQPWVQISANARLLLYRGLAVLALLALAGSFAFYGHTLSQGVAARLAVSAHVLAVLLWAGSLLPLLQATQTSQTGETVLLLRRFGQLAWTKLGIMLLTGSYLLYQLFDSWNEVLYSSYGRVFVGKLLLVLILLGFAALNKYRLVDRLERGATARELHRSITAEAILVLGILGLTAVLTTVLGPEAMN
ncbi:MAG: CopD family protein [Pseudomonadales bacterium]|nr:CopD family protein [Pseudomonadales bacterium]